MSFWNRWAEIEGKKRNRAVWPGFLSAVVMRLHRSTARLAERSAALVSPRIDPRQSKCKERGCYPFANANNGPGLGFEYRFPMFF
jgi:hypothetical protein